MSISENFIKRFYTAFFAGIVIVAGFVYLSPLAFSVCIAALWAAMAAYELPRIRSFYSLSFWLLVIIYILIPGYVLIYFNANPYYRALLPFSVLVVSVHDCCAYLVGSLWGTHLFIPHITPKKTWEGVAGGFVGLFIFLYCYLPFKTKLTLIGFTLIFSITCVTGDLFESWLKRTAGLKDSGSVLPGHGGLLDRFDALLFTLPVVYFLKETIRASII